MKKALVFSVAFGSLGLLAGGCVFLDIAEQQQKFADTCTIEGSAKLVRAEERPIIVVLFHRDKDLKSSGAHWTIVDHYVLERPGRWIFVVGEGSYHVAAFEDASRDLVYQPGEAFDETDLEKPLVCNRGEELKGVELTIPLAPKRHFDLELDIAKLQARSVESQMERTLGQLTAVGEIASLSDPRFKIEKASESLWRPFDAMFDLHPGIYFLGPHDPGKIPVLFVHGINGSPANFTYLIERLDRSRFEPWVYSYPSGVRLAAVADHLNQTMAKLQLRYRIRRFAVVAHSMGGLVSRGFLLRRAASTTQVPLFVTLSTPWDGHDAAKLGVKYAPAVVEVWHDMSPGSAYLQSLFSRPLPRGTVHHLIFTFNRNSASLGASGDRTVTVASQLRVEAQREAARLYGFDDSHDGVLEDPEVSARLNDLLARVR